MNFNRHSILLWDAVGHEVRGILILNTGYRVHSPRYIVRQRFSDSTKPESRRETLSAFFPDRPIATPTYAVATRNCVEKDDEILAQATPASLSAYPAPSHQGYRKQYK